MGCSAKDCGQEVRARLAVARLLEVSHEKKGSWLLFRVI